MSRGSNFLPRLSALAAGLVFTVLGAARADEGLWTFDKFPADAVKAKYGVTVDQAWLAKVQGATARLSVGCSASIVSSQGLVLTNHHCAADCAQDLSTAKTDYLENGFLAAVRGDERTCPGMQADILTAITDVTAQVTAATQGKSGEALVAARTAVQAAIERAACTGREANTTCEVVDLYGGGRYDLYLYRKYDDVRLVFAPEETMAFFGGDPDNFNFPRYDFDVAFLRLYVDGAPAATPDHLRWDAEPPRAGEPVFVVGDPGTTDRLLTAAQLETLRDIVLPQALLRLSELRGRLIAFGERGPEEKRVSDDELSGVENEFKEHYGEFQALSAPGFIEARRDADNALKKKVQTDPALAGRTGDPWKDIAAVQAQDAAMVTAYTLIEARPGSGSQLYAWARRLVRAAQERAKPNADRLPGYGDARLPFLEKEILDPTPTYPALERLELEFWLSKLRENLTADAPETRVFLGAESPEALAARLSVSGLSDPAQRKALWDGGIAAIKASRDPLILYVLATDPTSRAVRRAYEEDVTAPTLRASERIATARFAVYGDRMYPDATFTPRISYGQVEGWTSHGTTVGPFTDFAGLWRRATGRPPFQLAPSWLAAEGKLNGETIFNITTDNDIVGGNSGSPLINAKGEVIGAAFDGNILSLGGTFAFDDSVNRAVVVTTAAATEALDKVYGAKSLIAELDAP